MRNWHRHRQFSKFNFTIPLLILIWGSCYSPNKANKQVNKALKTYPAQTLAQLRDSLPCADLKIDTVYDWHDTTIFVECPPPKEHDALIIYDTITLKGNNKPVKVAKVISVPTATITKEVEDTARINALKRTIYKLEQENKQYLTQLTNCKGGKSGGMWWLIPVLIAIVSAFLSLLKYKNERKA
jgi:hypothetical protein